MVCSPYAIVMHVAGGALKSNSPYQSRNSIRLNHYDYSQNGAYFITICVTDRAPILGMVAEGQMVLSKYGSVVDECILKISQLHEGVEVHWKVVMPDHVHFILELTGDYEGSCDPEVLSIQKKSKMMVPKLIQQFKAAAVKECKKVRYQGEDFSCSGLHTMQPEKDGLLDTKFQPTDQELIPLRWQRNYYEHVIRNELEYLRFCEYIVNNPIKWELEKGNNFPEE